MVIGASWERGAGATVVGDMGIWAICSYNYLNPLVLLRLEQANTTIPAMLNHWMRAAQGGSVTSLQTQLGLASNSAPYNRFSCWRSEWHIYITTRQTHLSIVNVGLPLSGYNFAPTQRPPWYYGCSLVYARDPGQSPSWHYLHRGIHECFAKEVRHPPSFPMSRKHSTPSHNQTIE